MKGTLELTERKSNSSLLSFSISCLAKKKNKIKKKIPNWQSHNLPSVIGQQIWDASEKHLTCTAFFIPSDPRMLYKCCMQMARGISSTLQALPLFPLRLQGTEVGLAAEQNVNQAGNQPGHWDQDLHSFGSCCHNGPIDQDFGFRSCPKQCRNLQWGMKWCYFKPVGNSSLFIFQTLKDKNIERASNRGNTHI